MLRLSPAVILGVVLAAAAIPNARSRSSAIDQLSVKVSQEIVPPGRMAQIKVRSTVARPIITGSARLSFSRISAIEGISLLSGTDDAAGIAVVSGSSLAVSVVSPTGAFGADDEYPLLAVVARMPIDAPAGFRIDVVLDPGSLRLLDPTGRPYPTEVKPGHMLSGQSVAVHDVIPGSATLPGGSVVTIHGSNFQPRTEVRFKDEGDTELAQVRYISSTRIDVVLADTTRMHGMEIEVKNPDGSRATYFSYQRTTRSGKSRHPVLQAAVPLFRNRTALNATLHLTGVASGVALQNLEPSNATVIAELFTPSGLPVAATTLTVPSNTFVVRELGELFHVHSPAAATVRLSTATPVQVLGVSVDSAGTATPQLPL
jgi:hypothetical protein